MASLVWPDLWQLVLPQQESTGNPAHHYLQVHNTCFNTTSNGLPHWSSNASHLYQLFTCAILTLMLMSKKHWQTLQVWNKTTKWPTISLLSHNSDTMRHLYKKEQKECTIHYPWNYIWHENGIRAIWPAVFNLSHIWYWSLITISQKLSITKSELCQTPPPPSQPFYGPFPGTTRVSQCQNRTFGLYGARGD